MNVKVQANQEKQYSFPVLSIYEYCSGTKVYGLLNDDRSGGVIYVQHIGGLCLDVPGTKIEPTWGKDFTAFHGSLTISNGN